MNDEKNKTTSANEKQPRIDEDLCTEPGELGAQANPRVKGGAERDRGIMLVDRPPRPGTSPERFVHGPPVTDLPPDAVYINPPENITRTGTEVH